MRIATLNSGRRSLQATVIAAGLACGVSGIATTPAHGYTERLSVGSRGEQGDRRSDTPAMSADGSVVAFTSESDALVAGDANFSRDIFVRDRNRRTTELVSLTTDGAAASGDSFLPAISADGRFVAFASRAANLVPGDDNGATDVYVRDRLLATTGRVSIGTSGEDTDAASSAPSISADGRFVAYVSSASNLVIGDTNAAVDVFVRDRLLATTRRVSVGLNGEQADRGSYAAALSADGRFAAFVSDAANLVPADTNGGAGLPAPPSAGDVFVRDLTTGALERVSVSGEGGQADGYSWRPALSADGRYVVFDSDATNLVPDDANGATDVFVHDRLEARTERVDVAAAGAEANGPTWSGRPAISADGRFVAFDSSATNLTAQPTGGAVEAFLHDRSRGTTRLVSVGSTWSAAEGGVFWIDLSADGLVVAFDSYASNLVWRDTNFEGDVFLHRPQPPAQTVCDELVATIVGTPGDDLLDGTAGADVIAGMGGHDVVRAGAGDDVICGDGGVGDRVATDDGADRLEGGEDADLLIGQAGDDVIKGGDGVDTLVAGLGQDLGVGGGADDRVIGNAGADTLSGGDGRDLVDGRSGADAEAGGPGDDRLLGGSAADYLRGGPGHDEMLGESGDDLLNGRDGGDRLGGGAGLDLLQGEGGHDQLLGGGDDDRLYGEDGDDTLDGGSHLIADKCRQGVGVGTLTRCEL